MGQKENTGRKEEVLHGQGLQNGLKCLRGTRREMGEQYWTPGPSLRKLVLRWGESG